MPRADSSAAQRRRVHAAELRGNARDAVEHRRRALGWRRVRSAARDRHRAGESRRRVRPAHSARPARHDRHAPQSSRGSTISTRACTERRTSCGGESCAAARDSTFRARKPPWGSLVAIDLKTGARAWDVPLGDPAGMRPEFAAMSSNAARHAEPRRSDRDRGRRRVHRRVDGSRASRIRRRDRTRAVEGRSCPAVRARRR